VNGTIKTFDEVVPMIEDARGNLLDAQVDAIVNTVNTHGVMGKGIALQFKKAFPENFAQYERACKVSEVVVGQMFVYRTVFPQPRFIVNFPTKKHWRQPSTLSYIKSGLTDLIEVIKREKIQSIAVPPLGCGNGGLKWSDVRPLIVAAFSATPDVRVLLFGPQETPDAAKMPDRTERPKMTPGRAAMIGLMRQYIDAGHEEEVTLLEVQKLAYLLQTAGEALRLNFEQNRYGPYADNLRHVLNRMEGHFTRGFGDGSVRPDTVLTLLPGAVDEADKLLAQQDATRERMGKVAKLIEGFETPFGMELLATTHWVMANDPRARHDVDAVVEGIHSWNLRKAKIMGRPQILVAWELLRSTQWAFPA
jgi:O-acetyl-ADP-ribose deacetylase (regulator of RNase III)